MAIPRNDQPTSVQAICRAVSRPSHEIVTDLDNDYLQFFITFGNDNFIGVHYGPGQGVLPVTILPRQRGDLVELSLPTRYAVLALTSYKKSCGLRMEHTAKYIERCHEWIKRSISDGPSIELVYSSYTICVLAAIVRDRRSLLCHLQGFCAAIRALKRKHAIQEWEWKWVEVLQLNLFISTCAQILEDDGMTYAMAHENIILALWQEPQLQYYGSGIPNVWEQNLVELLLHIAFHLQQYLLLLNSSSRHVHLTRFENSTIPKVLSKLTGFLRLLKEAFSPVDNNFVIDFQRWHQVLYQKFPHAPAAPGTPNYFSRYNQVRPFLWNFYIFRREFPFTLEEYATNTLYEASVSSLEQLEGRRPDGVEIWLFVQDLVFTSGTEPRGSTCIVRTYTDSDGYASKHIRRLYKALQRRKMESLIFGNCLLEG